MLNKNPKFAAIELKAFVPARDFALSKRFHEALGFVSPWSDETLAYFHHGNVAFFLQNFYVEQLASNFMMHLLVEDVDACMVSAQESPATSIND